MTSAHHKEKEASTKQSQFDTGINCKNNLQALKRI